MRIEKYVHILKPVSVLALKKMHSSKSIFVLLASIIVGSNSNSISSSSSSTIPWPWKPLTQPEIIKNYQSFVQKILKTRDLSQINTITYDPFSVGHSLAVLSQRVVLNVSTQGFESVLNTPTHKLVPSYQKLLGIISKDPNLSITSTIYTQKKDVLLTVGLGKLATKVNLVDLDKSPKDVIAFINQDISNKTKNDTAIGSSFFPNGENKFLGFYANTLRYENGWGQSWKKVENKTRHEFMSYYTIPQSIEFMETKGSFEKYEDDNFQLVKIPLQGSKTRLLIAKTKFHITEWQEYAVKIWTDFMLLLDKLQPQNFSKENIHLEMPILESISGTSFYRELKQAGIKEAMCKKITRSTGNFLERVNEAIRNAVITNGQHGIPAKAPILLGQIAQLTHLKLNMEGYYLNAITGVYGNKQKVTSGNKAYRDGFQNEKFPYISNRNIDVHILHENTTLSVDRGSPNPQGQLRQAEINNSDDQTITHEKVTSIVLNQPFFWALEAEQEFNIPIALGAIINPGTANAIPPNFMEQYLNC